jgi:cyclophilin family peptidyl-prolyl cis-trans isomerase/uncharacterized cupredoxin-like copper-binding protein
MKSHVTRVLALMLVLVTIAASGADITATNQQAITSEDYLPPASALNGDWAITDKGERTKAEVADAIGSNGDELLTSWQWRENFYEDLNRNDAASAPDDASFINISVHRFANAGGASEALDFWSDTVLEVQSLQDTNVQISGYQARGLSGPGEGVNLYVLYVQDGKYVLRIGGSSATGDPEPTIVTLATQILTRLHAHASDPSSSDLPLATQSSHSGAGQTVIVTFPSKPMRLEPSTNSQVVITVIEGDLMNVIDSDPVQADGLTWWHVRTIDGASSGWLPDNVFTAMSENANGTPSCWTGDQETTIEGVRGWTEPPAMMIDPDAIYVATISTTKGKIIFELDAANAPIATNNFVCLTNAGYYDGTDFHRISSDFLIQGGDATGTGTGTPGYVVPSDPTTGNYPAGSVALAGAKPGENGAQFFIAVTDLTGRIPDDYPVFAQVISGQDVVTEISRAPVETNPRGEPSQPIDPTTIESIEVTQQEDEVGPPLPTGDTTPTAQPAPAGTVEAAPTVSLPPTEVTVIELHAKDIAFVPTELTIEAADEPVTIRMLNTGAALHDFSIDALDISVSANPGETVDIVIPAGTAPGVYDFYCNVPGHKEAGMVGKLIVKSGASEETSDQALVPTAAADSCEGFFAYQSDYNNAFYSAFRTNPNGTELLDSDLEISSMTSTQLATLGNLVSDVASELRRVVPPRFATEWHQLRVENYLLFAQFLESASLTGIYAADVRYSSEMDRLDRETSELLSQPNPCSAFVIWATEELALSE